MSLRAEESTIVSIHRQGIPGEMGACQGQLICTPGQLGTWKTGKIGCTVCRRPFGANHKRDDSAPLTTRKDYTYDLAHSFGGSPTAIWPFSRRAARALTMIVVGISLLIAACGTSGNAGVTSTPTTAATPTATATPLTCTTWRLIASPSPVPHSLPASGCSAPSPTRSVGGGRQRRCHAAASRHTDVRGTVGRHRLAGHSQVPGQYPLNSVAAVSLTDVWAVGGVQPNPQFKHPVTLILHWNGTAWTQVPSPRIESDAG